MPSGSTARRPDWHARRLFFHNRPRPRPANAVDRDRDWKRRLHEVMAFRLRHGRRPLHASADEHEMRLGEWITAQRSDDRLGKLAGHRRRWTDENVPDWRIPDRDLAGAVKWRQQLERVRKHRERTGRWPKVWKTPDAERQLANWLLTQRARARQGRLRIESVEALEAQLPGWRGRRTHYDSLLH